MTDGAREAVRKPVRPKETRVTDYLVESLFISELKSKDWEGVLLEMVECLTTTRKASDRDILVEMLKRRESLGSTGIGKGVAIPHGRSLSVSDVTVVFARSDHGVNFNAIDTKPVHLFFLIVAPPQDAGARYLPLLGKIVEVVKDARTRKKLLEAEGFKEVKSLFSEREKG
ncbi:MAG: PTS sugar transporter subunit IIA [Candidatus Eisenbacteria bacterium]|nr:PTS sugar transporter subunit IIA [Candidatus Eisenbacteria bacterium]